MTTHRQPEVTQPVVAAPVANDEEVADEDWADADIESHADVSGLRPAAFVTDGFYPRADFAAPDVLVTAYEAEWNEAIGRVLDGAEGDVRRLLLVSPDERDTAEFGQWLEAHPVELLEHRLDSAWVRDYGPIVLHDDRGRLRFLDLQYHADRGSDDLVPLTLAKWAGIGTEHNPLEIEGGGVISDGRGWCVMTEASLGETGIVRDSTNPSQVEIDLVRESLHCRHLSLVPALMTEQTGHIDVMAQFLSPSVLAVATMDSDEQPENSIILTETVLTLKRDARRLKRPISVVRVPMFARDSVFYSYINGTRLNRRFLVPSYPEVEEQLEVAAYSALRRGLPAHVKLVPVEVSEIVEQGGAIHCVTLGIDLPKKAVAEAAPQRSQPLPSRRPKFAGGQKKPRIPRRM